VANTAYVTVTGLTAASPSLAEAGTPAAAEAAWIVLSDANEVIAGPDSGALVIPFAYGAAWSDIAAAITGQVQDAISDPDVTVVFLPGG
jgi:hypothetical protein